MGFISIVLFFIYTWGLGFTVTHVGKIKESEDVFERHIMRIGIGLCAFILLGVLLNLVHVPLYWWIFFILSLVGPVYFTIKSPKVHFSFKKSTFYSVLALLIFIFSLFMYASGSYAYPYLEDDDPWSHALGVSYISQEKTIREPTEGQYFQYFDPYPPGYDLLMGVLHQTSDDIMFTLKFFNSLLLALGTLFFYYFARVFTKSSKKALIAAFCLAMVPAFLSHFIWALGMSVILYFVAFYATEKIGDDTRWWMVGAVAVGGNLLMTPTHSTYFGIFFVLYFATKCILERKVLIKEATAGIVGLMLSLLWWVPTLAIWGLSGTLQNVGLGSQNIFKVAGTGDTSYTLSQFIFAKSQNMINSPIGLGVVVSLLVLVFFISLFLTYKNLKEKNSQWIIVTLVWFVMTLYAVNAANMPIKISPFRTWMLLAIPVCLLAAQGLWFLISVGKKFKIPAILLIVVVLIGVFFTSGVHKYNLNTAQWPPGAFWGNMEEIDAYLWLQDRDENVFAFLADGALAGVNKYLCVYCDEIVSFREKGIDQPLEDYKEFLVDNNFDFLILGALDARHYGENITLAKMQEIVSSDLFSTVHQTGGALIVKVA
ncbi:MAG: hypothetical protein QF632_04075 [Candidatus Woesearchaeota archaeon]|jgi:hypothetical protein|nr:hypothetical protein [Candidatus Woesearchaeota archaeon]MDP7323909.1 hypothetical protein [Candidatus Woesearchaeota archaeon]MDP7457747.1 hypothetical protein [Candidatus Woesearchaeota archaeon]